MKQKAMKWKKEWKGEFQMTKEDVWSVLVLLERVYTSLDVEEEKLWKAGWNEALKAAREALDVEPF